MNAPTQSQMLPTPTTMHFPIDKRVKGDQTLIIIEETTQINATTAEPQFTDLVANAEFLSPPVSPLGVLVAAAPVRGTVT
jgi:hypothetical protein